MKYLAKHSKQMMPKRRTKQEQSVSKKFFFWQINLVFIFVFYLYVCIFFVLTTHVCLLVYGFLNRYSTILQSTDILTELARAI